MVEGPQFQVRNAIRANRLFFKQVQEAPDTRQRNHAQAFNVTQVPRCYTRSRIRWREQASYALGKGTEYTLLMRRVSGATWSNPTKLTRQLYQAVVIPRTTYAASIWIRPTYNGSVDTLIQGSTGIAKKIGRAQRSAATTILGVLRTSPLDSLEVHAFLLPAPLLIQDILYRPALRLARLPKTHLLHPKMKHLYRINRSDTPIYNAMGRNQYITFYLTAPDTRERATR